MSVQAVTHPCPYCGDPVPVTKRTAYEFDWRCSTCQTGGVLAWATENDPPEFSGETQPSLFGEIA